MEIRNPLLNPDGTIDCEIEHPVYGWIPFTANQNDVEEHGREIFALALAMNPPLAPVVTPTPEEIQAVFVSAIDAHVEAQARSWSYNGAAHLASYVTSTVPAWAAEAQAFVAWRDAVWVSALQLLAQVQAGEVAPPSNPAEFISTLPALTRP